MDIDSIMQNLVVFARENVIVTVIISISILYLLYRRPKVLLSISLFLMAAYGLAWLFEKLSKTGLG